MGTDRYQKQANEISLAQYEQVTEEKERYQKSFQDRYGSVLAAQANHIQNLGATKGRRISRRQALIQKAMAESNRQIESQYSTEGYSAAHIKNLKTLNRFQGNLQKAATESTVEQDILNAQNTFANQAIGVNLQQQQISNSAALNAASLANQSLMTSQQLSNQKTSAIIDTLIGTASSAIGAGAFLSAKGGSSTPPSMSPSFLKFNLPGDSSKR